MFRHEIRQLASDLLREASYAERCGIPLIIATCNDPRGLTRSDFDELESLIIKQVPDAILLFRPS